LNAGPIVIVGSINLDLVTTVAAAPRPGETVTGTGFATIPGGKGANQAVAAARLGQKVAIIGMLGDDLFGQQLRQNLSAESIDTTAIGTHPGSSGTASITVDSRGENSIIVVPGSNAAVTPQYLEQHFPLLRSSSIVLAQLEIPLETVLLLARFCAEANVPFILDPAPAQPLPDELFPLIDWFTPNETEAAFYAGNAGSGTPETLAAPFLQRGVKGVILKRGAQGALIATKDFTRSIPSHPVKAIDTTAAGDCFNGAFASALVFGRTPVEAVEFAVAAAAISVTRPGAQPSIPYSSEVEAFLNTHPQESR
jgi:ribokinase